MKIIQILEFDLNKLKRDKRGWLNTITYLSSRLNTKTILPVMFMCSRSDSHSITKTNSSTSNSRITSWWAVKCKNNREWNRLYTTKLSTCTQLQTCIFIHRLTKFNNSRWETPLCNKCRLTTNKPGSMASSITSESKKIPRSSNPSNWTKFNDMLHSNTSGRVQRAQKARPTFLRTPG